MLIIWKSRFLIITNPNPQQIFMKKSYREWRTNLVLQRYSWTLDKPWWISWDGWKKLEEDEEEWKPVERRATWGETHGKSLENSAHSSHLTNYLKSEVTLIPLLLTCSSNQALWFSYLINLVLNPMTFSSQNTSHKKKFKFTLDVNLPFCPSKP